MKNRAIPLLLIVLFLSSCTSDRAAYIEGYKLWKKQKFEAAISKFQTIVFKSRRSKHAIPAQFNIGSIYYVDLKRYELAVIEFTKVTALSREKGEYSYRAQRYIADIYREEFKNYERAIYEYRMLFRYSEVEYDLIKIMDSIYTCYLEAKLYSDAEKEFRDYLKRFNFTSPEKGQIYLMLGNLATLRDHWKDAIKYYEKASEIKEFRNDGLFMMADLYYSRKKYKTARPYFQVLFDAGYKPDIIKGKLEFIDSK
ncbi:tetratricopeptide repeat protein [bacterium]|nr:tetratricopeptide repeat protein [bacterium]